MEKIVKRIKLPKVIPFASLAVILLTIVISFVAFIEVPTIITAYNASTLLGNNTGRAVGLAIGSAEAISGAGDRINDDIDNETDNPATYVEIDSRIKSIGLLEVLSADVKIKHVYTVGGKDTNNDNRIDDFRKTSYAALYVWDVDGVFTVDLSNVSTSISGNNLIVSLNQPKLLLRFSNKGKNMEFEYVPPALFGQIDKEYDGYLNSEEAAIAAAKENISGYPSLLKEARESAEKMITMLYEAMRGNAYSIVFNWKGETGEIENAR